MSFSGIGRDEVDELVAGDLFVVAGFPEVEIGDTLADPANPVPLPRLTVDEPVLRMTFGVNTSPLAGKDGKFLTSRHLRDRLDREVLGNVSIKLDRDRFARRHRGRRPRRAPAGRAHRDACAVRATSSRSAGPRSSPSEIDGKRHEPLRARRHRRPRRARRHRHPGPRSPQGPGHRPAPRRHRPHHRHLRGPVPRPHRLPLAAAHRHPRHGADAPAPRRLDAVGRATCPHPQGRRHDLRPHRRHHRLRARQPPAARRDVRRRPARQVYEGMVIGENAGPTT